jgi:Raf kinase inhibitor-like YbhB/YbcL family protein
LPTAQEDDGMPLTIRSPAFPDGGAIPAVHTCQGKDRSPALAFAGIPAGARSLALVVEDPDAPDPRAPRRTFSHWLAYDLAPDTPGLPEGVVALPAGARAGKSDFGRTGYGGPCPPIGRHRYFFRLYALDALLGDLGALTRPALLEAMKGHVLEEAAWMGTYEKS